MEEGNLESGGQFINMTGESIPKSNRPKTAANP